MQCKSQSQSNRASISYAVAAESCEENVAFLAQIDVSLQFAAVFTVGPVGVFGQNNDDGSKL